MLVKERAIISIYFKMANEKEDFSPLLEKDVKITVRHGGSRKDTRLKFFVGMGQKSSLSAKKELHVRLTDENDPFFMQFLYLAEEDFQMLKEQQGLLVDFSAFPQKFIDLIDLCNREEESHNPRFLLQFTTSGSALQTTGQLDVVETNPFKHLIHLSLKFLPGNDEEIKKYLVMCIRSLKDSKLLLEEKVSKLEDSYSSSYANLTRQLAEKSAELEDIKTQWTMKLNELSSKHLNEMSLTKQQERKLQNDYEEKLKSERSDWEEKYHKTVNKLEKRNSEIESINKDLTDKKFKSESLIRELKIRISNFEEECRRMTKELQTIRRQNSNLDSDRHEKDKTLNHLRTRVAVLEQELKDKEMVISKSSEMLETSNSQKKFLDEELKEKGSLISRLEGTIKSSSEEIIKGNEIIKKLQNDIKNLKSQLSLKNVVTTKQERVIEEKEALLVSQKKTIDDVNVKFSDKEQELHKISEELKLTRQRLQESQELISTNENVINWLNKQLNEQMLGGHGKYSAIDAAAATVNSLTNSNASRIPSRVALHHSTPASGYTHPLPTSEANIVSHMPNQVVYRPLRRTPSSWQSPPSTTGDGLTANGVAATTTLNMQYNRRQPLQRMPANQPIREQTEPVVDMKYLQVKSNSSAQNRAENLSDRSDISSHKRKAKPFIVQTNLEKENNPQK